MSAILVQRYMNTLVEKTCVQINDYEMRNTCEATWCLPSFRQTTVPMTSSRRVGQHVVAHRGSHSGYLYRTSGIAGPCTRLLQIR